MVVCLYMHRDSPYKVSRDRLQFTRNPNEGEQYRKWMDGWMCRYWPLFYNWTGASFCEGDTAARVLEDQGQSRSSRSQ